MQRTMDSLVPEQVQVNGSFDSWKKLRANFNSSSFILPTEAIKPGNDLNLRILYIPGHGGTSFAHFAGQASEKLPAHELKAAGSLTKSDSEIKALGDASKLRAKKSSGRIRVTLGDLIVGDNDRPNLNLVTFCKGTATIVEMRKAARLKMALIKLSRSLSSSVKRALSLPKNMPRKLASKRVKRKGYKVKYKS
ncbi:hypothetical protein BY996DRAFT_6420404 [Phakopsora pachyrhizi]|nr:hypothetical protein BY996DRAFT_6420404 [Phakopsora pachyrhizi]